MCLHGQMCESFCVYVIGKCTFLLIFLNKNTFVLVGCMSVGSVTLYLCVYVFLLCMIVCVLV